MKREEFIKEIEELGLTTMNTETDTYVMKYIDEFHGGVGMVREDYTHRLDTDYDNLSHLKDDERAKLFDLMVEYAKTPIKER